jgi:hypothetical protein
MHGDRKKKTKCTSAPWEEKKERKERKKRKKEKKE